MIRRCFCFVIVCCLTGPPVHADPWAAPADYYAGATGTGATLESQLQDAMSAGHIQRQYGNFRDSAVLHDADPDNPGNILLGYNRASVDGEWDSGSTWNREHVWPQSLQPGSASNSSTGNLGDPHALRPLNPSINSSRGNKAFGNATTTGGFGSQGTDFYFPGDADKGDTARQLFYSATRYDGLTLVNGVPGTNQMGDLASLIAWHYLDTPDEFERRRNHVIFSQSENPSFYTNNRSAYVDHPEFVWSVFVDQENNSRITIDGAAAGGDGGSSLDLDLGRVLVGGPGPSTQQVTLDKAGTDGTYYEVATSGAATSSVTGRYNAFRTNGTDSATITVGLDADPGTAGLYTGSVTVDNLDVTTEGGAGRGANDADDVVTLAYTVLNHSNASFNAGADDNTLTLDFGVVDLDADADGIGFSLFNFANGSPFVAGLDLDAIGTSGDTDRFTTDLSLFSSLAAGDAAAFTADLFTDTLGTFSAVYTLATSDENLPGAAAGAPLTLTLTAEVIPEPGVAAALAVLALTLATRRRRSLLVPSRPGWVYIVDRCSSSVGSDRAKP